MHRQYLALHYTQSHYSCLYVNKVRLCENSWSGFLKINTVQAKGLYTPDLIFWKLVDPLINSWSITYFFCFEHSSMTVYLFNIYFFYIYYIHPIDIKCPCTLIIITSFLYHWEHNTVWNLIIYKKLNCMSHTSSDFSKWGIYMDMVWYFRMCMWNFQIIVKVFVILPIHAN